MIFVTIGTSEPFDRLLRILPDAGSSPDALVVQRGPSALDVPGAQVVEFVAFDELCELVRTCRAVVCHAGVGTILVALSNGKRPIVMPRRARYGEAVDDHQVLLAERLAEKGLVTIVEDAAGLRSALERLDSNGAAGEPQVNPQLVSELRTYVAEQVHRNASRPSRRRRTRHRRFLNDRSEP